MTSVIVLAAGHRRLMKTYGPTPLLKMADRRPLLRRQLDAAREVWPGCDLVVAVGFGADRVVKALPPGVRAVENESYETTGPARSLNLGLRAAPGDRVVVLYGDTLVGPEALAELPDASAVLCDGRGRVRKDGVGLCRDGPAVSYFGYGLPLRLVPAVVLAGRELELVRAEAAKPASRKLLVYELLNAAIDRDGLFRAVEPEALRLLEVAAPADARRVRETAWA